MKKGKNKLIISVVLISLILIAFMFYFGFSKQNFFNVNVQNSVTKLSENPNFITYKIDSSEMRDYAQYPNYWNAPSRSGNLAGDNFGLTFASDSASRLNNIPKIEGGWSTYRYDEYYLDVEPIKFEFKNFQIKNTMKAVKGADTGTPIIYNDVRGVNVEGYCIPETIDSIWIDKKFNPITQRTEWLKGQGFQCYIKSGKLQAYDSSGNEVNDDIRFYGGLGASVEVDVLKTGVECISGQLANCNEGQICENNKCVESQAPTPPTPQPSGFTSILQKLVSWLNNLWDNIFKQSIVGDVEVQPGSTHTYQIDLSATSPDSDYSDGSYSTQFSNWALIDSSGNILKQGNWEQVNGQYSKSVILTVPTDANKQYALIGVITEIQGNYDYQTGQWVFGEEQILNKEAIDIKTLHKVSEPTNPTPSGFSKFISSIVDWFKNIFGGIFG